MLSPTTLTPNRAPRSRFPRIPTLKNSRRRTGPWAGRIHRADRPFESLECPETAGRDSSGERWNGEDTSALTLYMREVGQVNLLTPEEELALARRIQAGDDQARDQMIRANLRLVVKIARDYDNLGVPLLDLINEGNLGLMKAVERFDPEKGAKLSSYSSWWIKQSMRRALANQARTIRVPVNAGAQMFHLRKAEVKLQQTLGRKPNDEELGQEVGLSARRVGALRDAAIRPASLDAPLCDEDASVLADIVPDENADNPAQRVEDNNSLSLLDDLIERLPPREAQIVRARFGLDGGPEKTLEEVGACLGLTRERIRQLQNLALTRLRRMLEEPDALEVAA